jgi:hypothetical protein
MSKLKKKRAPVFPPMAVSFTYRDGPSVYAKPKVQAALRATVGHPIVTRASSL